MKRTLILMAFISAILFSFRIGENVKFVVPENWPQPEYNFSMNPLYPEKIELGRVLFYDPILSRNNSISCSSCHSQFNAFTHADHALSHGIEDKTGTRNSPALMNLAWHKTFMWDGAINHLDMQALFPISQENEMGEKIENVVLKLQNSEIYPEMFYHAYNDSVVTGEHLLKALSQFVLTFVSKDSKYDSVMRKQAIFTGQEENGYKLFSKNCSSCHAEPLFTNLQFENNGLAVDSTLNDYGRMKITNNRDDSLKFKVPTLRNVEFTFPYMHDGRFKRLSDVLNHYTAGIRSSRTLSEKLSIPVVLTSDEKADLIAFLLTLTDKKFLFDPEYSYPKNILLRGNIK